MFFRQYLAFPRHRRGKLGGPCCLCFSGSISLSRAIIGENWGSLLLFFSGSMSLSFVIVWENWVVPVAFVFQAVSRFPAPSSGKTGGSLLPLFFSQYLAFPRHRRRKLGGPCCLCFSGSISLSHAIVGENWGVPVAFVFQAVSRFPAPSSGKTGGSLLPSFFRQYIAFPRHRRGNLGGPCCLCFSGGISLSRTIVGESWVVPVAFCFLAVSRFPAPSSGKTRGVPVAFVFQAVCRFLASAPGKSGGSLLPLFFKVCAVLPC